MIPKIINKLNSKRPTAEWIQHHSRVPYLSLDIQVPTEQIMEEWHTVAGQSVAHRPTDRVMSETHRGWRSLTLHGVSPTMTEQSDQPHRWTEIGHACPMTREFLEREFTIDTNTSRIRFMLLAPGGYILPHHDYEEPRLTAVNIAISNPSGAEFRMMNHGIVPFSTGKVIMLDLSHDHWVINDSDQPRLHIIFHGDVPAETIERSYANSRYRD